jgi:hypothetical protein
VLCKTEVLHNYLFFSNPLLFCSYNVIASYSPSADGALIFPVTALAAATAGLAK